MQEVVFQFKKYICTNLVLMGRKPFIWCLCGWVLIICYIIYPWKSAKYEHPLFNNVMYKFDWNWLCGSWSRYFIFFLLSPLRRKWLYIWTKLNPRHARTLSAKFDWYWLMVSSGKDVNFITLFSAVQTRIPSTQNLMLCLRQAWLCDSIGLDKKREKSITTTNMLIWS